MKAAAVAIGVDKTGYLTPLNGATSGAEDFARWARGQGMDVTLVTDRDGPVQLNDLLDAVEPIVNAKTYDKLVVFFAGHGFLLGPLTELWLLSKAPDRAGEAVNVQLSRDFARYCGIPHVIFVSDACRSGGPSHRHRQVVGGAMFPSPASFDQDGEIDTFYGTRPGNPALEFASDDEAASNYKGVFTECLLAALGKEPPEVAEVDSGGVRRRVVPCRPLKKHLRETVPLRAESISIKLTQDPEVRVESDLPRYFGTVPGGTRGGTLGFPSGPATEARPEGSLAAAAELLRAEVFSRSPTRSPGRGPAAPGSTRLPPTAAAGQLEDQMAAVIRSRGRRSFETATGFTIYDRVRSVTLGAGAGADLWQEGEVSHVRVHGADGAPGVSILLELSDGTGTVLAVKPYFVGTVLLEEGKVVNVNYTPAASSSLYLEEYREVAEDLERRRAFAAATTRNGVFEFEGPEAEAAGDFLRMRKRLDPTLGIYAAYAYHQAGKVMAIRDLLTYMVQDPLPVPFDVPLLARLDGDWPPCAPFCPMLSPGWALLDFHPPSAAALRDLRPLLIPALWTTLTAEGVDRVRQRLERGDLT